MYYICTQQAPGIAPRCLLAVDDIALAREDMARIDAAADRVAGSSPAFAIHHESRRGLLGLPTTMSNIGRAGVTGSWGLYDLHDLYDAWMAEKLAALPAVGSYVLHADRVLQVVSTGDFRGTGRISLGGDVRCCPSEVIAVTAPAEESFPVLADLRKPSAWLHRVLVTFAGEPAGVCLGLTGGGSPEPLSDRRVRYVCAHSGKVETASPLVAGLLPLTAAWTPCVRWFEEQGKWSRYHGLLSPKGGAFLDLRYKMMRTSKPHTADEVAATIPVGQRHPNAPYFYQGDVVRITAGERAGQLLRFRAPGAVSPLVCEDTEEQPALWPSHAEQPRKEHRMAWPAPASERAEGQAIYLAGDVVELTAGPRAGLTVGFGREGRPDGVLRAFYTENGRPADWPRSSEAPRFVTRMVAPLSSGRLPQKPAHQPRCSVGDVLLVGSGSETIRMEVVEVDHEKRRYMMRADDGTRAPFPFSLDSSFRVRPEAGLVQAPPPAAEQRRAEVAAAVEAAPQQADERPLVVNNTVANTTSGPVDEALVEEAWVRMTTQLVSAGVMTRLEARENARARGWALVPAHIDSQQRAEAAESKRARYERQAVERKRAAEKLAEQHPALQADPEAAALAEAKADIAAGKGAKADKGKPRLDLLPPRAIMEIGACLREGAKKYGADNWRKVPGGRRRYVAAGLRHAIQWLAGEQRDPETGCHHLAVAATNFALAAEYDLADIPEVPEAE